MPSQEPHCHKILSIITTSRYGCTKENNQTPSTPPPWPPVRHSRIDSRIRQSLTRERESETRLAGKAGFDTQAYIMTSNKIKKIKKIKPKKKLCTQCAFGTSRSRTRQGLFLCSYVQNSPLIHTVMAFCSHTHCTYCRTRVVIRLMRRAVERQKLS